MPDTSDRFGDDVAEEREMQPEIDLYDPWQRQFKSSNKQNAFRKALEDTTDRR